MATLNVPGTYPTIAAALAVAVPTDTIVVAAGYPGNQTVTVGVDNVSFDIPASVTGIELRLATGVTTVNLLGGSPIDVLGNSAANTINGNAGDNYIDGASGNDTMAGGAGNDTYVVLNTGDVVIEGADAGIDTVRSGLTYTLGANVENLVLTGTASRDGTGNELDNILTGNTGDNTLSGNAGTDTLTGDAGNDVLDGGTGADTMIGGAGDDKYYVDNPLDVVVEAANEGVDWLYSPFSIVLPANVERLILTGTDNIDGTGNELDNSLSGNVGNNLLDGGLGADAMVGGKGNDTYIVDNAGDVVVEIVGQGTDTVRSSISYTLDANVENLVLTGTANLDGKGNQGNNVITGNAGDNTLDGGGGIDSTRGYDTLIGGAGNDTYLVSSPGFQVVVEEVGGGIDTIKTIFSRTLEANVENLVIFGERDDYAIGNELDNSLTGNRGNNALDGKAGADTMIGGLGHDTYKVDNVGDVIVEAANEGLDRVQSSVSYTLSANVDYLTLTGTANIDAIGNDLYNELRGNSGNNILDGKAGADDMYGGAGDDTYYVDNVLDDIIEGAGNGNDTVMSTVTYALTYYVIEDGTTVPLYVENLTLLGSANINGTGNIYDNILIGNSGNNVLKGDVGADVLQGGLGNDTLEGNATGDAENDQASYADAAGAVKVSLAIAGAQDTISAGFDTLINIQDLTGSAFDDTLTGNALDNVLDGGVGADLMYGGAGNDSYRVDNSGDKTYESAGAGTDLVYASITHVLRVNVENLVLTGSAAINGVGNDLDNHLTGNLGNNVLDGGLGADTMTGGAGNDTYVVDNVGDIVIEAAGQGTDAVRSWIDYTLTDNVEKLTLYGTADLHGTGNALANTLIGNVGNNVLDGGLGADTMTGGLGDDTYIVDNSGDRASEDPGGGFDTVMSSVTHMLKANIEMLVLTGSGAINGIGNAEDNVLEGNAANNILDGGAGADQMAGGAGNDTYVVENAGDVVVELAGGGTDSVRSWLSYTLGANVEKMTLQGTANLDGTGNELVNTLIGNAGNNVLDGGLGADVLQGGAGDDTYVFSTALGGGNVDKVIGFVVGEDTIHLDHDIFAALSVGPLTAAEFNTGSVATQADDRILFDSGTGAVYYDADGAGGVAAVKFATLTDVTGTIDHTAFFVV